ERRRAEGESKRADWERKQALASAEQVKLQQKATEAQRLAAREEADRAREVTRFLVGMFDATDPLGLNGTSFNQPQRAGEELKARELIERAVERITADKSAPPRARADILDAAGN